MSATNYFQTLKTSKRKLAIGGIGIGGIIGIILLIIFAYTNIAKKNVPFFGWMMFQSNENFSLSNAYGPYTGFVDSSEPTEDYTQTQGFVESPEPISEIQEKNIPFLSSSLLPKKSPEFDDNDFSEFAPKAKNFLNADRFTIPETSSKRNSNMSLRSEPANPRNVVTPWMMSTIEPDTMRKTLDIGGS